MSRLIRLHGAADSTQGIFAKAGIVEMHRQVCQHQAERRSRVLEIVDEKRRDRLECLAFLARGHFGGQAQVEQTGTDLTTDTFEQVNVLDRVRGAVDAIRQYGGAEAPIVGPQRHANPMTAMTELAGADFSQFFGPFSA